MSAQIARMAAVKSKPCGRRGIVAPSHQVSWRDNSETAAAGRLLLPRGSRRILERRLLASLDDAITVGSNGNDRADDGRNMALIKEGEFESPEMIAVIEGNREDRERTVVIDR